MPTKSKVTTDHALIRRWVEARGGMPAHVTATARGKTPGILRIDYPGYSGRETLEPLSWDQFFIHFDKNRLAFVFEDDMRSRFSKLVDRASVTVTTGSKARAPARRKKARRLLAGSAIVAAARRKKRASAKKKRPARPTRKVLAKRTRAKPLRRARKKARA